MAGQPVTSSCCFGSERNRKMASIQQSTFVILLLRLLICNVAFEVIAEFEVWPPDPCYPTNSALQDFKDQLDRILIKVAGDGKFESTQNQSLNLRVNCSSSPWGNVVNQLHELQNSLSSLEKPIQELTTEKFQSSLSGRLAALRSALNGFAAYEGDRQLIQERADAIQKVAFRLCTRLIQLNQAENALALYRTDMLGGSWLEGIISTSYYNKPINLDAVIRFCHALGRESERCFPFLRDQLVNSNSLFSNKSIWNLRESVKSAISTNALGNHSNLEDVKEDLDNEAVLHYSTQIRDWNGPAVADEINQHCPDLVPRIYQAAYGNNLANLEAVVHFCNKTIEKFNCFAYLGLEVQREYRWYENPKVLILKEVIASAAVYRYYLKFINNNILNAPLVRHYSQVVRSRGYVVNRELYRMFDPQLKENIVIAAYDGNLANLNAVISFIENLRNDIELVACYDGLFEAMKVRDHFKSARNAKKIKMGPLRSKLQKIRGLDAETEQRRRALEQKLEALEIVIAVDNGGPFGTWGEKQHCPPGSRAIGFNTKNEKPVGPGDDTALNGIRLLCYNGTTRTKEISSSEGQWGTWPKIDILCQSNTFLTSFRLSVENSHYNDKTGVNEINMFCSNDRELQSGGNGWGTWGSTSDSCPQGICGIQTKVDPEHGRAYDDTALNDVKFFCC